MEEFDLHASFPQYSVTLVFALGYNTLGTLNCHFSFHKTFIVLVEMNKFEP